MFINPQKCLHLKDELKKKNPKLSGEYIGQIKRNGWYVQIPYDVDKGWLTPKSSSGREIPSLSMMPEYLFNPYLPKSKKATILIAEAVIHGIPFHEANGLFNRFVGNYILKDGVTFHIHDYHQQSDDSKVIYLSDKPYKERMFAIINNFRNCHEYIVAEPFVYVGTFNEKLWHNMFMDYVEKGEEGLVFKRASSIYMPGKKNADVLKLKMECTVDALAYDFVKSIGEKGNTAYTLYSKRKNGIIIKTLIGKHSLIDKFLNGKSSWYNKVVEIKGMEEMPDGTVYQPVFVRIRDDKNINDYD